MKFKSLFSAILLLASTTSHAVTNRAIYATEIYNGSGKLYVPTVTPTASRACVLDGSSKISSSTTTATQIGYLDTLSSNVQTQLNAKEPTISTGTNLQYIRGDKSLATLNTSVVPEGSNEYFTNGRAQSAMAGLYEVPLTFSTGLTRSTNTITVNASQNISTLSNLTGNGFVKTSGGVGTLSIDTNTYLTGNQTITLSGDISGSGATAITTAIGSNKVTNAMLATMATASFKGRTTAGTGNVEDLSATQATALLNAVVGDSGSGGTKGLVPAPGTGDAAANKYLKADGAFNVINVGTVAGTLPVGNGGTGQTSFGSGIIHSNGTTLSSSAVALASDVSGALPIANGGTGQTSKAAGFDALSPMTTSGDIIYGGASGTGTRLAKGSDGQFLTLSSGIPAWSAVTAAALNYTARTSTYTAVIGDFVNATSGTFTVTLPTAASQTGKSIFVKNSGTGIVTVATTSSQTIDGSTTFIMPIKRETFQFISDGSNWFVEGPAYRTWYFSFGGASNPSVCTGDPCTVYVTNMSGLVVNRGGTGQYKGVISSGVCSTVPVCGGIGSNDTGGLVFVRDYAYASSTTQFGFRNLTTGSGSSTNGNADVQCSCER